MYYDFDFKRDKAFFKKSPTFKKVSNEIMVKLGEDNADPQVVQASLLLWAESTIKHNLDINMTRVDVIHLLSEENSSKVLSLFGKIMFKEKDKRTREEFCILSEQSRVHNYIVLELFAHADQDVDVCADLKREFVEFKNQALNLGVKP